MISDTKAAVNDPFIFILAICVLLLVLILFFMIFFIVRYRRSRNPHPAAISGNALLETVWIIGATLIVLPMFFYAYKGFEYLRTPPADGMQVTVIARQWSWLFQYPNGLKSGDLVVPQGVNVVLTLESLDVIHGFFVPHYRIKQDVVPGMHNKVWFKATDIGISDLLCSQYCGQEHSKMLAKVAVIQKDLFDKWYNGEDVQIPGLEE
jgi:cytochrome c oxidase subunit 2